MSLLRAAGLIAILSLASKGVGLVRDQVVAYYCGLSMITDAYNIASLIPVQFALIMLGGLNGPFHSAIVSTLTRHFKDQEHPIYGRVITTAIVLSVLLMGSVSLALYLFAPQLIALWGDMKPETAHLAILQLRIMAPVFMISGLIGILYGILSIKQSFITPSLSPIMASLGIIVALALFAGPEPESLARSLAWGTLIGAAFQLILQVLPLLGFFRSMHFEIRWNDPQLMSFLHLLLPAVLSSTIGQFNSFIIQFFASGMQEGGISAFIYGNRLIQLPLGILLTALLVPLLPLLSASAQIPDQFKSLKQRLNQGLRPVLLITFPVSILLIFFGYFAIIILFQRGAFNSSDSRLTYEVLVYLSLSIAIYAVRDLFIRAFYALGDSRTPFWTSFVTIAAMVIGSFALAPLMQVQGVALASSLAVLVNFCLLSWLLHRRIGSFLERQTLTHLIKVSVATLPMAFLGWQSLDVLGSLVSYYPWPSLLQAVLHSILLIVMYVLLLFLMEDQEVLVLGRTITRRFKRHA